MKTKFLLSTALVLTLVLAACAPKVAAPTKQASAATAIPPVAKSTPVPTKIIKPTPTISTKTNPTKEGVTAPTPTAAAVTTNDIIVDNQDLKSGSVLVNM